MEQNEQFFFSENRKIQGSHNLYIRPCT